MNTLIEKMQCDACGTYSSPENMRIFETAGKILREGGLVAFPTETVYGLGANALDATASAKIYAAKGRPSDNPLIVHIADKNALYELSDEVTDKALLLAERFWPGPLTMVLKKSDAVPYSITGGLDTVAIRFPAHPVARKLIETAGVYIAAPSANISGKPSPTKAKHVIEDMDGRIDMIIADDSVEIGVESTIIDISEDIPVMLRPGYITKAQLEEVLGEVKLDAAIEHSLKEGVVPKAPGMKYTHYSPDANVVIVEGNEERVIEKINELVDMRRKEGFRTAVMTSDERAVYYKADKVVALGSDNNEAEIARNLFAVLRSMDEDKISFVYSEKFPTNDVGQAVMNRLIKAAGHTIIYV